MKPMKILGWELTRQKGYTIQDLVRDVGFGAATQVDPFRVISEAFAGNATVYAATRRIASACASVPWIAQQRSRDGDPKDLPSTHEVARLLAKPNPWSGMNQLVEAMAGSLILHGTAYSYLNGPGNPREETAPGRAPREAIWIPTQWVETQHNDATMETTSYKVSTKDGVIYVPPHRMVAVKFWDPSSPSGGQGRVRAAAHSIDLVGLGRKWNRSLLTKGARPPGVLEAEGELQPATIQRLRQEMTATFGGADNAGKPPILDGGLKWKATGMTATDMEYMAGMQEAKREIAVSIGVDPSLIGDPHTKTFANYAEARLSLYQDEALPILGLIRQAFESRLQAWFPDVVIHLDTDKVPALLEAKRSAWKGLAELVDRGLLTRNEARREMGFDDVPGGDDILVPIALVPLSDVGTYRDEGDPAAPKPDPDDSEE